MQFIIIQIELSPINASATSLHHTANTVLVSVIMELRRRVLPHSKAHTQDHIWERGSSINVRAFLSMYTMPACFKQLRLVPKINDFQFKSWLMNHYLCKLRVSASSSTPELIRFSNMDFLSELTNLPLFYESLWEWAAKDSQYSTIFIDLCYRAI